MLNHIEIKNIYEYLGSNVLEGFRKGKTLKTEEKYTMAECKEQHGLITDKVWFESFEGLDTITENYIRNMRANGEKINKNPRIIMSTIHGAKGGEADKVLLMQDIRTQLLKHLVMTRMNYIDYFIPEQQERSVNCTSWTQEILIELIYYEMFLL